VLLYGFTDVCTVLSTIEHWHCWLRERVWLNTSHPTPVCGMLCVMVASSNGRADHWQMALLSQSRDRGIKNL